MKKILLALALLSIFTLKTAHAQQVQTLICFQVPGTPYSSCVPVSVANPLPTSSN